MPRMYHPQLNRHRDVDGEELIARYRRLGWRHVDDDATASAQAELDQARQQAREDLPGLREQVEHESDETTPKRAGLFRRHPEHDAEQEAD